MQALIARFLISSLQRGKSSICGSPVPHWASQRAMQICGSQVPSCPAVHREMSPIRSCYLSEVPVQMGCRAAGGPHYVGEAQLWTFTYLESGWPELAFFKCKGKENPQIVLSAKMPRRQVLSSANLAHPHGPLQWQLHSQNPSCVGHFMLLRHKYRKRTVCTVFKFFAMLFLNATSPCPAAPYTSLPFC